MWNRNLKSSLENVLEKFR